MGRFERGLVAPLVCLVAAAVTPAAWAQVGQGVSINRPSLSGPSQWLDIVGGQYTREAPGRPPAPIDVSRLNARWGLPPRSPEASNYELAPLRFGLIPAPYQRRAMLTGELADWQLRETSGFWQSTRADTPLAGWAGLGEVPLSRLPRLDVAPEGSAFHRFFNLVPTETKPARRAPAEYAELTATIEEATQKGIARTQEDALKLFRAVTSEGVDATPDSEKLRHTIGLLSNVRDLDGQAYVPSLLLAHVYLHRGQITSVVNSLTTLARRHPEAFAAGPDVASYFGDFDARTGRSAFLQRQMRELAQTMSTSPTVDGAVLEAYSARVLGDKPRATSALDRAEKKLAEGARSSAHVEELVAALRYGL
jgi:hypothetical protein